MNDPALKQRKTLPIRWSPSTHFKIPIPRDEKQRLAALKRYDILDTPPEDSFDSIVRLASHVCATPVAMMVLIDHGRQWFKARVGIHLQETRREFAFCAHTIMQRSLIIIPDLRRDQRFAANPFVAAAPHYCFYAAAPLITPDNRALGTICVIDKARRTLTARQKMDLLALSRLAMTELELRRNLSEERRMKKGT